MKILSNANLSYSGNCSKCGCVFELPFSELKSEYRQSGTNKTIYNACPHCSYLWVPLVQKLASPPIVPADADQPITAQELYDFLQEFNPRAEIFLYINGEKYSIMEMSDENGNLVLIPDKEKLWMNFQ